MLSEFEKDQKVVCKILENAIKKNKFSHAYLFETNGYYAKNEFVNAFVKQLLCLYKIKKCTNCKQCFQIDNNICSDVEHIYPDGLWIKKEQLDKLQKNFSTKSINGKKRVYIIHEAEKMNVQAANSILKFLEEPEDNIIAILMTDNVYQLLNTIVSRCQLITLSKSNVNTAKTMIDKIKYSINSITKLDMNEEDLLMLINKSIMFVNDYEDKGIDILITIQKNYLSNFKERKEFINFFEIVILYYIDIMHSFGGKKTEIFDNYQKNIELIKQKNTFQEINNKINLLIRYKKLIKYNVNTNLLFDKLIIELERCCK